MPHPKQEAFGPSTSGRGDEALRRAEAEYRTILDGIEDSYLEVDLEGNIRFFNASFCRLIGFSREELIGKNNRAFMDAANARKTFQIFHDVYRTGKPANNVGWEFIRKDGARRYIEASVSLITDMEGNRIGFRGIGRDATERRQAEASTRQVMDRTETILQTIQSGLFVIDAETRTIIDVNRAAEAMIGTGKEQIIGRVCHQFVCPMEQGNCPYQDNRQDVFNRETVLLRHDGGRTEILKTVSPVLLDGRECLVESFVDISGLKRAEEAAHAHQERFKKFFSSVNDAIFVHPFKEEGFAPFIEVNDIACRRYGYSRDEFLNLTAMDITQKVDVKRHATAGQRKKLLDTKHQVFESVHIKKNGETFPVEINSNIVEQFGKPVILAVVRDISERKRAEAEKERIESQYRQAQKVEAIGRLAGGVAHDLNNLLSPIIGYGEMLLDDINPDDPRREFVDEMVNAGYRARDIVRQLLAFGRMQTLEYKKSDLNEIIAAFESLLRRTIREDIEIEIIRTDDLLPIKADIGQIEQVIMNLAVNAQDAMQDGGTLTIKTAMAALDERPATGDPGPAFMGHVVLAVTDTGCGIDEATREHMYEPFFSTKGEKGTGLGLATVYGIVKQHGGNIRVESKAGEGTTFTVYLPATEDTLMETEAGETSPACIDGSETILLVEDSEPVRNLSLAILQRNGYTVIAAKNGSDAMAALAAHNGKVDLLLTDVIMPDMNGRELFESLAEKYPGIRVLYMSGYTDNVIAHHGVLDQGVQLIQKPFSVKELGTRVRAVLSRPAKRQRAD